MDQTEYIVVHGSISVQWKILLCWYLKGNELPVSYSELFLIPILLAGFSSQYFRNKCGLPGLKRRLFWHKSHLFFIRWYNKSIMFYLPEGATWSNLVKWQYNHLMYRSSMPGVGWKDISQITSSKKATTTSIYYLLLSGKPQLRFLALLWDPKWTQEVQ